MAEITNKKGIYNDIFSLFDALLQYELYLISNYGEKKGKEEFSQLLSAICRHTLPGMGHPAPLSRRPTRQEAEAANAFLKTIGLSQLSQLLEYQQKAFANSNASRSSRSVYKSKLKNFLDWAATQVWFPTPIKANKRRNYCPPMRHGFGRAGDKRTTDKTQLPNYRLEAVTEEEIQQLKELRRKPNLIQEQKDFVVEIATKLKIDKEVSELLDYWFKEDHPGRLEDGLKPTRKARLEGLFRQLLGWKYGVLKKQLISDLISKEKAKRREANHKDQQGEFDGWGQEYQDLFDEIEQLDDFDEAEFLVSIGPEVLRQIGLDALKQTNLEALVPHPDTEGVTPESAAKHVDKMICAALKFMKEERNSESPYTWNHIVDTFEKIFRFHWHTRAENGDYQDLKVMGAIRRHRKKVSKDAKNHDFVADIDLKWLDMPEVLEKIVKTLRLECGYRLDNGKRRSIYTIACSFQDFIVNGCLTFIPPRRQQEWREAKLANSCLLSDKPSDLQPGQFIHPLPPKPVRWGETEKYFPYIHRELDGTWRLHHTPDSYKTGSTYGKQNIRILNPQFADGKYFYDYIEAFVYGYYRNREGDWYSGGEWDEAPNSPWQSFPNGIQVFRRISRSEAPNSSWQFFGLRMGSDDLNTKGNPRTVSQAKGREMQPHRFEPECVLEQKKDPKGAEYSFLQPTHFFFQPTTGTPYSETDFGDLLQAHAHRLTGQLMNPHLLRDIYATWFLNQKGKGEGFDSRIASLAYAMGHSVEMLYERYDKRTEDQRRRAAEEAMEEVFKQHFN